MQAHRIQTLVKVEEPFIRDHRAQNFQGAGSGRSVTLPSELHAHLEHIKGLDACCRKHCNATHGIEWQERLTPWQRWHYTTQLPDNPPST